MGKEIGIDLGTTNTVVSYVNKHDRLVQLSMTNNEHSIPSVVYFKSRNEYIIGKKAKRMGMLNSRACVSSFKSKIGDAKFKYEVKAENGDVFKISAKEVTRRFLSKVIYEVQDKISKEFSDSEQNYIDKAVITIPAKFNPTEKEITRLAALAANLKEVQLMPEPTAAAIAYMEDYDVADKTILVYDFGGGTFDISVVKSEKKQDKVYFKVIRTDGDKKIGGDNITMDIARDLISQINEDFGYDMPYEKESYDENYCALEPDIFYYNYCTIVEEANRIKEYLSDDEIEGTIYLEKNDSDKSDDSVKDKFDYFYTADELNQLIKPEIVRTVEITKNMLLWLESQKIDVDTIILSGGSSQIPIIHDTLSELFECVEFDSDVLTIISRGAAIVAKEELSDKINVEEKTNAEIGVKSQIGPIMDAFKMIIPDNQPLPYTASEEFAINNNNSDTMKIAIYERDTKKKGTDETIRDKRVNKIDEFVISNLDPQLQEKNAKLRMTFTANTDGSLDVFTDILINDSVISSNHKISKESNLYGNE